METEIKKFFDNYAQALLTYNPEKVSEFYQVPMAVYSDDGIILVSKEEEVLNFWKQGLEPYKQLKIESSFPDIISSEILSKTILICKILWKNFDKEKNLVSEEINTYILSANKKDLKISGLIIMAN